MQHIALQTILKQVGIHFPLDANPHIIGPARIEEAEEGHITFLDQSKYQRYLKNSKASAVFIKKGIAISAKNENIITIPVENPRNIFAQVIRLFSSPQKKEGISKMANIATSVMLGKDVAIGDFTVVEDRVKIGDNTQIYPQVYLEEEISIGNDCIIFPGVKILSGSKIGDNCIVHAGTVIGSEGFGYFEDKSNVHQKMVHFGGVLIENDVEIGANCTIDKALLGNTIIRNGAKLDNLIQIGHNVEIGEHTVIAAQSGFSGSSKIGHHSKVGGQAGIAGHIKIAPFTQINGQTGMNRSINEENKKFYGTPALEYFQYLRAFNHFKKLDIYTNKIAKLEQEICRIQKQIGERKTKNHKE